jgi:hypothetical protein
MVTVNLLCCCRVLAHQGAAPQLDAGVNITLCITFRPIAAFDYVAAEYFYTKVQHLNWMLESGALVTYHNCCCHLPDWPDCHSLCCCRVLLHQGAAPELDAGVDSVGDRMSLVFAPQWAGQWPYLEIDDD